METGAILVWVAGAGLIGGAANSIPVHEGVIFPRTENLKDGTKLWRPGFIGNVFFGAVAALLVAILYSPLGAMPLGGTPIGQAYNPPLTALGAAFFAGTGAARILTSEIEKRRLEGSREDAAKALGEITKLLKRKL